MSLKLAFVQGPRDGESLEYKPGSTIRIGRVVRGNEIAIKDAGISTKHLCIVSDSENWIIHDLGSSNGTILNSETLDSDIPVTLRHGDVIKLGESTSIVVNFETDVQAEEHKLPPRPRRNNRRLPVADPDPVEEKHEPPKRTRATRSKAVKDIVDNVKEVAITKEEEAVPVEKKSKSRARGGKKNTEAVLNSIKLENDDTTKGVEISAVKRVTKRKCLGLEENVKCEDTILEEKRRPSRATRSNKKEIGGDSFLELEMVLSQARKSRAKKKKPSESVVEEMIARNEEDEISKGVEQVETESRKKSAVVGEEDLNCSVRGGDGPAEKLQDAIRDCKSHEAGVETSDGGCAEEEVAEQESKDKKDVEKVDLEKMTLGEWFKYMEVHLRKQIMEETEKMIEPMASKALRVQQYIAEQKQAKRKGSVS